jgi:hypothetical protein
MIKLPSVDTDNLLTFLVELLNTPSPTGFTHQDVSLIDDTLHWDPELTLSTNREVALDSAAGWIVASLVN